MICNFANKTNSTFCNRVASITDAIFYDEQYPRILNYQVSRKKKSNFKIKKKFGKRGKSNSKFSRSPKHKSISAECNVKKSDFETNFFTRSRAIFNVQSVYKLFAKYRLYAKKAIKYVLNRGFYKIKICYAKYFTNFSYVCFFEFRLFDMRF